MNIRHSLAVAGCLALMMPAAAHAQDTFTFEGQGTTANFLTSGTTLTADNNSARSAVFAVTTPNSVLKNFAFEFGDNGLSASPNFGTNLAGVVLMDGSGTQTSDVLTLTFAQAVNAVSFNFAINDSTGVAGGIGTDQMNLSIGGFTNTFAGAFNNNSTNYEGSSSVSLAGFGSFTTATIFLTGNTNTTYYLDNLTVSPVAIRAVPEPGAFALLAGASLPLVVSLRRRRK